MGRLISLRQPVVRAIATDTGLSEAARLMQEHGIDAVVVLDGDVLAGVLSLRDIAGMAARRPAIPPCDLRAADAMAAGTLHAESNTTVPQALAMLDELERDHLPVMAEAGRVADLISRTDLLKELVWHYNEVIREMRLQERIMHLQGVYSC